jgi:tetratricopeptide (TPR) repeat protein
MRSIAILRKIIVSWQIVFVTILLVYFQASASSFSDWHHGAAGYERAYREALAEETPLLLYFHTEWCRWSKKMDRKYIDSYEVSHFLSGIPKAEINPDEGTPEETITKKHGVTGYPKFLVLVPSYGTAAKSLYPFRKGGDWTASEFVDRIKTSIADAYNNKGHSHLKSGSYEKAVDCFQKTLSWDPENSYAYYGTGHCYYQMGYRNRDIELLREANTNYEKALEQNPNDAGARRELPQLEKLLKSVQ